MSFKLEGDCYTVERESGGAFLVRHFPNRKSKQPCCSLRVRVTEEDRAQATGADPFGECAAMHRCYLAMEQKHALAVPA
jgi:hypothetical protein